MAELVKVSVIAVEDEKETLKLTVLNEDQTAVFELSLGKMKYSKTDKKWSEDPETYDRFVENLKEVFVLEPATETTEATILELAPDSNFEDELLGKTLHVYQRKEDKVSFWDGLTIDKPANALVGDIEKVEIIAVQVFDTTTRIVFEWIDGNNYAQNFRYGNWIEALEKNIPNPAKRKKAEERFKKLTGVNFDDAQSLIGKVVQVEIKENSFNPDGDGVLEMKRIK